jgi:hypothetical protein
VARSIILTLLIAWTLLVAGHLCWYLRDTYAALPSDEVYANSLAFQFLAFGLTRLPGWLLVLVAALLVAFVVQRRR